METKIRFEYDQEVVERRIALRKLKNVQDPERPLKMRFSKLKSSILYSFDENFLKLKLKDKHSGYSNARTTRGLLYMGKYYWQIKFLSAQTGFCRLGISTIKANINAPAGYDEFGYSLRSKGDTFHCSKKGNGPSFKVGDTIGFGLDIGPNDCSLYVWVNGEGPQLLFEKIEKDEWFPSVSLYRDAEVEAMFDGPFDFLPAGWTPAGSHPIIKTDEKYTPEKLYDAMKGKGGKLTEDLLFIINDAIETPDPAQL